jgi:hypothetical protein
MDEQKQPEQPMPAEWLDEENEIMPWWQWVLLFVPVVLSVVLIVAAHMTKKDTTEAVIESFGCPLIVGGEK